MRKKVFFYFNSWLKICMIRVSTPPRTWATHLRENYSSIGLHSSILYE